jgi:hypothetical protein
MRLWMGRLMGKTVVGVLRAVVPDEGIEGEIG